jgi:predicted nucleic acid-binding protein
LTACYLDASALVKLATREAESDALRDHLAQYAARITSRLAHIEVTRALVRRGEASAELADDVGEAFEGISVIELDERVALQAGRLQSASLRSLDAIHLASALSVRDELEALVTYDVRLADAARGAGLTVIAPA